MCEEHITLITFIDGPRSATLNLKQYQDKSLVKTFDLLAQMVRANVWCTDRVMTAIIAG